MHTNPRATATFSEDTTAHPLLLVSLTTTELPATTTTTTIGSPPLLLLLDLDLPLNSRIDG